MHLLTLVGYVSLSVTHTALFCRQCTFVLRVLFGISHQCYSICSVCMSVMHQTPAVVPLCMHCVNVCGLLQSPVSDLLLGCHGAHNPGLELLIEICKLCLYLGHCACT